MEVKRHLENQIVLQASWQNLTTSRGGMFEPGLFFCLYVVEETEKKKKLEFPHNT